MMNNFFNQRFWQNLVIAVIGQLIVLVIAVGVSLYVGGYLEQMTALFESIDNAVTTIERVVENVNPEEIAEMSDALNNGAQVLGDGVGEGGADVVNKVGDAWNNFRNNGETNE